MVSREWEDVTPAVGPRGRAHCESTSVGNKVIVFGGDDGNIPGALESPLWVVRTSNLRLGHGADPSLCSGDECHAGRLPRSECC